MFSQPLPFIKEYLNQLEVALKQKNPHNNLSKIQWCWLAFCLMGILVTNSICWAKFERAGLKSYKKMALSAMFRCAKIAWNSLLICSVRAVLHKHGITEGVLVIDDKDHSRSKNAEKLHHLHKIRDKKTSGYFCGQNIVFLQLVTKKFCIPVSFAFYSPDPVLTRWQQEVRKLKKLGISKKDRPKEPKRSIEYPKKYTLALQLLKNFACEFPAFKVTCVLADALYGNSLFVDGVEGIWPGVQIITQLRKNQKVMRGKKSLSCQEYFEAYKGWNQEIFIRGDKKNGVQAGGARLYVPSHHKKRLVIALKYEGENEYRYLMAANLSWNMKDVMQGYTLRWLVEVFIEDWSSHCGFCSLAKQCGVEGSERPLILSLLFDHCFLFHLSQTNLIKNKLPLATLGSLVEKSRVDALCQVIREIVEHENSKELFRDFEKTLDEIFVLRPSRKHLNAVQENVTFESSRKVA
ncbi:transposase [Neochlamydia sp. S13]|uniref:transposase n=1 Tax=Neochlamydia sp. S13 TaxID=1353976 RepID=UPI000FD16864|nr:transposase [Neochlamydia sp. S13]BBI17684.1 Transposase family protein [Neochlamydia sp. S13]